MKPWVEKVSQIPVILTLPSQWKHANTKLPITKQIAANRPVPGKFVFCVHCADALILKNRLQKIIIGKKRL